MVPRARRRAGPEDPVISIVMPAYNEASMLEASVRDVVDGHARVGQPFEVHVVENGSTDGTPAIAARLAEQMPEVTTSTMRAADYGEALRTGLLEASGEVGVIFDVDYYDLDFLKEALELLDRSDAPTGPAIVVGSKRAPGCPGRAQPAAPRRDLACSAGSSVRVRADALGHARHEGAEPPRAARRGPRLPLGCGPVRHRAHHPGRAQRTRHRGGPGDGQRAAAVSHVDRAAGAADTARVWRSCGCGWVVRRVASTVVASATGRLARDRGRRGGGAGRRRDAPGPARPSSATWCSPGLRRHPGQRARRVDFWRAGPDEWRDRRSPACSSPGSRRTSRRW